MYRISGQPIQLSYTSAPGFASFDHETCSKLMQQMEFHRILLSKASGSRLFHVCLRRWLKLTRL